MEDGQSGDKILAVIPARGGSKRLPGKNIMDFYGKPMITWTIEAAIKTGIFDDILVSTDDEETAKIAKSAGAQVPFLRDQAFDDISPVSLATMAATKQMQEWSGKDYSIIVQLMANCPLRGANSIVGQINNFKQKKDKESVLSGFSYGMTNPWWAHKIESDGSVSKMFPNEINMRSQDLPKLVCPTGATWVSSRENLEKYKTFYSPGYSFFELNWMEGIDIDDRSDYELARAVYSSQTRFGQ